MFDIILRNGIIADGTGQKRYKSDIGISSDKILKIGDLSNYEAKKIIDVNNLIIAPGFIDSHTHSDFFLGKSREAPNKVMQGITTEVTGNCGFSPFPVYNIKNIEILSKAFGQKINDKALSFINFYNNYNELGLGYNCVNLIGHGTLRANVIGFKNRKPTDKEMNTMKELLEENMKNGAFGLSIGLEYLPALFAETKELIELAKTCSKYNGVVTIHLRNQADNLLDSINEAIKISREANVKLVVSHIKCAEERNWHKMNKAIELIEEARKESIDIICDVHPYNATNTVLIKLLPKWAIVGGIKDLLSRLENYDTREMIKKEIKKNNFNWNKIIISDFGNNCSKQYLMKSISNIAKEINKDNIDTFLELVKISNGNGQAIFESLSDEDIKKAVKYDKTLFGSDSMIVGNESIKYCHPRNFGTFPKILRKFVKEEEILNLEDAIRKMTGDTANFFNIKDRGFIKEGMYADITIFNLEEICDQATLKNPTNFSKGIQYVIINGKLQLEKGKYKGVNSGQVLKLQ